MRLSFFSFLIIFAFFASCSKSSSSSCPANTGIPDTTEISNLRNFIATNALDATFDSRGFYYKILGPGYGARFPTLASTVTVSYRGSLTNGTVFDSTETGATRPFVLGNLILGWQYGIPLVKKDGVVDLYLPPSLGYGCNGSGKIPGNSILIFRIILKDY